MIYDRWRILKAFFIVIVLLILTFGIIAVITFVSFLDNFAGHMEALHQ